MRVALTVADFLNRGGWVVATGIAGAQLLPGGATAQPSEFHSGLCYTVPDGDGALVPYRAGETIAWRLSPPVQE